MRFADIVNRYYAGSAEVTKSAEQRAGGGSLCQETLSDAVTKARERLEKDPSLKAVPIVRVVGIVRRRALPVVLETDDIFTTIG